jgi:hypothetical protein
MRAAFPREVAVAESCYAFHTVTCEHLERVYRAAVAHQTARGVLLLTHDPDAAVAAAREIGGATSTPVYILSMAARRHARPGATSVDVIGGTSADSVDILRAGADVTGPAIVVFQDMLRFMNDGNGDPRTRAFLLELLGVNNRKPHVYVFCEPPDSDVHVPSFARTLLSRIPMPLPGGRELLALTKEEVAIAAALSAKALSAADLDTWARRIAAHLPGLSSTAARFAIQDALGSDFQIETAGGILAARKAAHLHSQLAMEVLKPTRQPPVGMENFYRWLRVRRDRMCVPGPNRVKGALLIGPPGTGKTRLGAYLGSMLGVDAIWFRFGALLGMYVGQSEANAERAFAVLDALGTGAEQGHERGVVVLLDELEKTIGQGDNDGGVSRRVVSRLLTWMSESTAPNMILATANDLESMGDLGDIITRRGRLNRIFFVDVPNTRARQELFTRLIEASGAAVDHAGVESLAKESSRFTGADIEGVVDDAADEARATSRRLEPADMLQQIEKARVQVHARYEKFNRLREWARLHAEPAGDPD